MKILRPVVYVLLIPFLILIWVILENVNEYYYGKLPMSRKD